MPRSFDRHPRRDRGTDPRYGAPSRPARLLVAIACLACAPLAVADGPRLFTTPEQRDRLDLVRAEATAESLAREPEPEPEPAEPARPAAPKPPPRVELQGFVRRSKGPSAVWANGGNTLSGDSLGDGISAGRIRGTSVVVTLPDGQRITLKPGQTWDPEGETVTDVGDR